MNKLTKIAVFMAGIFISASSVFAATSGDMNSMPSKNSPNKYDNSNSETSGFYMGAKLGISIEHLKESFPDADLSFKYKTKNTPHAGLTLGYDFNDQYQIPIRTELDYTFRKEVDIKAHRDDFDAKTRVRLQTAMLNAYYDFYTDTPITPYLGAGLGYANLKLKTEIDDDKFESSHNKLAWTLGAGIGYKVSDHVNLLVGYQYLKTREIKTDVSNVKASSNDIFAGVNYYF